MLPHAHRQDPACQRRGVSGEGVFVLVAMILFALFLLSCTPGRDLSLQARRAPSGIRIGYAVEEPYAFVRNGEVTGESPELAKRLCLELGIPNIEWVQVPFDKLLSGLEQKRFDVIAAGMFITPERKRRVAFSLPTLRVKPALLVRKGNPLKLRSLEDLHAKPGVRVAVLAGAEEDHWLREHLWRSPALIEVPDAETGKAAVSSGVVDTLLLSAVSVLRMAESQGLEQTEAVIMREVPGEMVGNCAFAFRQEDVSLRTAWDEALARFIGSKEHRRILKELGMTEFEVPAPEARGERTQP